VAAAGRQLDVAQPTISAQIRRLERAVGGRVFQRSGRRLSLTDLGRRGFRFADEIFSLGRELEDSLRGRPAGGPLRFVAGVAQSVPRAAAWRLLEPVLALPEPVLLVCQTGRLNDLLAAMSIFELDVVLSDAPVDPQQVKVRAFSHLLCESEAAVFGTAAAARKYRRRFPASLEGAPFLLPAPDTALRRSLERWFDERSLRPRIRGEFEDGALLKHFAAAGAGLFAGPGLLVEELRRTYGVRMIGRIEGVREHYFAISVERMLKHPAVAAMSQAART
jgi:LysR family transcriptional activator of nhaA